MEENLDTETLEEEADEDKDFSQKKKKNASDLTLELLQWPRLLEILSSFSGTSSSKEIIQVSDFHIHTSVSDYMEM